MGTLFFDYPLNYGAGRSQYREVADNNYNTFTTQTSMLLHIDSKGDGTGEARAFTDIFVKAVGCTGYAAALTNPVGISSPQARTFPDNVINDSGDTVLITDLDGFKNDLHSLWTDESTPKPKAKSVTLSLTGTSPQLYEVMILDRILTLNADGGFSKIEYDSIDLGVVDADLRGRLDYVPPINAERDKWLVNLSARSLRQKGGRDTVADLLIHLIRRYKSFVFAPEYNRYPERVFPAVWPSPDTQIRFIAGWKGAGRRVHFSVREA
ncbi:MAG: hypothetical protein OXL96_13790 [Candidatus Poribacteria bacterium]|nr:hypothetical protein [Candidatus Poribacteria bacterium]